MQTQEVIEQIASRTNLPANQVRRVLKQFQRLVTEEVNAGNPITLTGFVQFAPVDRAPREGRNPHTGEVVHVPAKRTVAVKAMTTFKREVTRELGTS